MQNMALFDKERRYSLMSSGFFNQSAVVSIETSSPLENASSLENTHLLENASGLENESLCKKPKYFLKKQLIYRKNAISAKKKKISNESSQESK